LSSGLLILKAGEFISGLELNSAGQRQSRIDIALLWCTTWW